MCLARGPTSSQEQYLVKCVAQGPRKLTTTMPMQYVCYPRPYIWPGRPTITCYNHFLPTYTSIIEASLALLQSLSPDLRQHHWVITCPATITFSRPTPTSLQHHLPCYNHFLTTYSCIIEASLALLQSLSPDQHLHHRGINCPATITFSSLIECHDYQPFKYQSTRAL
jgi:hypothetical protein